MVGNQLINNLLEFLAAIRRNCMCFCCDSDERDAEHQWGKDNLLNEFNSNTLIDEYLELSKCFLFNTLKTKLSVR
jgi:hypothetical protein